MRGRLDLTTRFPVMKVLVDFDDLGFDQMDNWSDITDHVLDIAGSKEKEGETLSGVSSDIVTFTLDNSDNTFSKDNSNSPYNGKIKSNIRFVIKTGFKDETLIDYAVGYVDAFKPRWKGKEVIMSTTCPMSKLKKTDSPSTSFQDITWDELVNVLLDEANIDPYFTRNIPKTEFYFRYFKFEEEKCFDDLKKLMEMAVGQAYFEGDSFDVKTKLALDYTLDTNEKHDVIVDDLYELEENVDMNHIVNKVSLVSEYKDIAPLQVVWETPDNFVKVQNEQVTYDGSDYVYINGDNIPIYWDESEEINVKNLSTGANIEWDVYNAELGRIKLTATGKSNCTSGDLLSVSYTYQKLVLLPGDERKYVANLETEVNSLMEPDVIAWNADASAQVPYSTTPDTSGTLSKQALAIKENGRLVELVLKNNTNDKVSISTLQLRGYPIKVLNPIEVYNKDVPSINEYDVREVKIQNNYINNLELAEKISEYLVDNNSQPRKRIGIQINGYPELLLNDIMKVTESDSGTNHKFTIERVNYNFSASNGWTANITLLELDSEAWVYTSFSGESYGKNNRGNATEGFIKEINANVISNGGAELYSGADDVADIGAINSIHNVPDYWTFNRNTGDASGRVRQGGNLVLHGKRSFEITTTNGGTGYFEQIVKDVTPSNPYVLTLLAKADSCSGLAIIEQYDSGGGYLQYNDVYISNYNEYELAITSHSQADKFLIRLLKESGGGTTEDIWFDKVKLENADVSSPYIETEETNAMQIDKPYANSVTIGNQYGIEVYDDNENTKVRLGQYEGGKYGLKIYGGGIEIVNGLPDSEVAGADKWDAKETPEGAQDKADNAETNAKDHADSIVEDLTFGGRNLLFDTGTPVQNSNYSLADYNFDPANLVAGEVYTVSIKFTLGADRSNLTLYSSDGYNYLVDFYDYEQDSHGVVSKQFTMSYDPGREYDYLTIYQPDSSGTSESRVEWIKVESGNKPTAWSPAPEDIDKQITDLNDYVDGSFKDGVITEAEAISIDKLLKDVEKEKTYLDARYNYIFNQADLVGTPKTTLSSKKSSLDTAHTNLVNSINTAIADGKTTSTEKADVDSKFEAYETTLNELSTAFEDAIESIAQKKASDAEENAKDHADNNDENLRTNLQLDAPLPTDITLNADGITAGADQANSYARLDYRGLYVHGGAIQIENGLPVDQMDIDVGGRNLLLKSKDFDSDYWIYDGSAVRLNGVEYNGTSVVRLSADWSSVDYGIKEIADRGLVEAGDKLTLSFYAKLNGGTSPTKNLMFYFSNNAKHGTKIDDVTDTWKKYSITFTLGQAEIDGDSKLRVETYEINGTGITMDLANYKLEKGNIATGWSEAPEDLEMNVGGTNLVPDSKIETTSSDYGFGSRYLTMDLVAGETYTITMNGRIDSQAQTDGKTLTCYVYEDTWTNGHVTLSIDSTTDETKSIQWTPTWTGQYGVAFYMAPDGGSRTGTVTVNWVKVEKGNTPTDWTPAPQDTDVKIDQVRTDLQLDAPLPTDITMDENGITAGADQATSYARLDYRGLYIHGGAIQIGGGLSDDQIASSNDWNSKETPQGAQDKADSAELNAKQFFQKNAWKYDLGHPSGEYFSDGESQDYVFPPIPSKYHNYMKVKLYQNDMESAFNLICNGVKFVDAINAPNAVDAWVEFSIPSTDLNSESDNTITLARDANSSDGGELYRIELEFDTQKYAEDQADSAETNAKTYADKIKTLGLGVQVNHDYFGSPNNGEIYLHGFDANGDPANVDGFIMKNGAKKTVNKGVINPSRVVDGFIMYDDSDGYWYVTEVDTSNVWTRYNLSGTAQNNTTFVPDENHFFVGTMHNDAPENVKHVALWNDYKDYKEMDYFGKIPEVEEKLGIQGTYIDNTGVYTGIIGFDQGYGGTLTLGGMNNDNGKMVVLNSDEEVIADLDANKGGFQDLYVAKLDAPNVLTKSQDVIDYYVSDRSAYSPSDSKSGIDWNNSLRTISEALRRLPKYLSYDVFIHVSGGSEQYETINVSGFSGGGTITIGAFDYASMSDNCNLHGDIYVRNNGVTVKIDQMNVYGIDGYSTVSFWNTDGYLVRSIVHGNGSTTFGVDCLHGAFVQIGSGTEIYDCDNAIASRYGADAMVLAGCVGLGNSRGLYAYGGNIYGNTTAPAGSSTNTYVNSGGYIYPNFTHDSGSATPPPPPETTSTWGETDAESWRENYGGQWSGGSTGSDVIQGKYGSWGNYKGLWFFGSGPTNTVTGKTIKQIRVYVTRNSSGGYSSDVPVTFRMHGYNSKPGYEPSFVGGSHAVDFSWGEGKWVTLPSSFHSYFEDGTAHGIGIYTSNTADSYYARMSSNITLEITYS